MTQPTSRKSPTNLAGVFALSLTLALPVSAQTASSANNRVLEEVIVSARKREETTFDIPSSVAVFDRQKLADQNINNMRDLQASIPNFFFSAARPFTTTVSMRGLGAATTTPPGVGLYIDGAYQPTVASFNIPFFDLERVEVLKGPQGTLYGRNSFAGVINYVTRKPGNDIEADVEVEVGNAATQQLSASLGGPIVSDMLYGRVTVGTQRRDGWWDYTDGRDADQADYDAASVRLIFTPSDRLEVDFKYSFAELEGGSFLYQQASSINDESAELLSNPTFDFGPFAGQAQREATEQTSINLKITYSFDSFDLVSLTTDDQNDNLSLYDVDIGPSDVFNVETSFENSTFSQELRLQSTGDGRLNWLFGGYYTEGDTDCCGNILSGLAFLGIPGETVSQPFPLEEFDGYSIFADIEYELSDRWTVGFGLRYDEITASAPVLGLERSFDDIQPKVTAKYALNDNSHLYGFVSSGFREGGLNPLLAGTNFEYYPADELDSYELGYKARFADGAGSINFALFYIDVTSLNGSSVVDTPVGPRVTTVPIGEAESYGVEVETSYSLSERFSIDFFGGYNIAEPTKLVEGAQRDAAQVGEQLPVAPEWSLRLAGNYSVAVFGDKLLRLQAAASAVGPTNFPGSSTPDRPALAERDSYLIADASASLDWGQLTFTAFVRNLTDELFAESYIDRSVFAAFGGSTDGVFYNQPRYYGVSVRWSL